MHPFTTASLPLASRRNRSPLRPLAVRTSNSAADLRSHFQNEDDHLASAGGYWDEEVYHAISPERTVFPPPRRSSIQFIAAANPHPYASAIPSPPLPPTPQSASSARTLSSLPPVILSPSHNSTPSVLLYSPPSTRNARALPVTEEDAASLSEALDLFPSPPPHSPPSAPTPPQSISRRRTLHRRSLIMPATPPPSPPPTCPLPPVPSAALPQPAVSSRPPRPTYPPPRVPGEALPSPTVSSPPPPRPKRSPARGQSPTPPLSPVAPSRPVVSRLHKALSTPELWTARP